MTLQFTITPRRSASSDLRLKSATVEQLTAQLATHKVGEKDGPALIPAVFKPCPEVCWHHRGGGFDCGGNKLHRLTENVTAMTMLAVDIDKVLEADFDALQTRLADSGLMFWWWHTHSHVAGSGVVKARFLFPFDKHLPLKHGLQWKRWAFPALLTALDLTDVADPACKDPGRVYYLPRKPSADFPHAAGFHPGGPLNWEEMIGPVPETMPQAAGPSVVPVGLPLSPRLEKAIQEAISKHGQAVAGDGGNDQAYTLGALLCRDWALSHEQAMERALEWDRSNDPPWQDEPRGTEQLETIIRNGSTYANGQLGSARLKLDPLGVSLALVTAFESLPLANQADDDAQKQLLDSERLLVRDYFTDPMDRAKLESKLEMLFPDRNKTALALPRVKLKLQDSNVHVLGGSEDYGFDCTSSGVPIPNLNNATIVLEKEKPNIWYDEFFMRGFVNDKSGTHEWADINDLDFALGMQRRLGITKMPPEIAHQAVVRYSRKNTRNTVVGFFETLHWDGTDRIADFLVKAYGVTDSEYVRSASANFWKSLVARPLMPGCKVDNMLVLEGLQGKLKSTSLSTIAGDGLFMEANESVQSKDFFLALQGKLLVEISEMDAFNRADVSAVKRVVSCRVDRYRAPYERATRDWPRQGIFVGTTNKDNWAKDDTGGRRFWPIRCIAVDLNYIRTERHQLFAEAASRVRRGEAWWEMPAEATAREQAARRQDDPWEDVLSDYLAHATSQNVTVAELLTGPLGVDTARMTKGDEMRVGSILRGLGYEKVDGWLNGKKAKFWQPRIGPATI